MVKHAQGEKINLTLWICHFKLGITRNYKKQQGNTSKRAGGNGEALKGDKEVLKGNIKALKDDK